MNKTKYDNKPWLRYSEAVAESLLSKRQFDRLVLNKGDHFCVDDDGYILFAKEFLDDPRGRKVFSFEETDIRPVDERIWEYTLEKEKNSKRIGGKWLSYRSAVDYSGLEKDEFDSRYINNHSAFRIKKGKLRIERDHLAYICEDYGDFLDDAFSDEECTDYGQWLTRKEAAPRSGIPESKLDEVVCDGLEAPSAGWDGVISLFALDSIMGKQNRWYKSNSDSNDCRTKKG